MLHLSRDEMLHLSRDENVGSKPSRSKSAFFLFFLSLSYSFRKVTICCVRLVKSRF